MKKLVAYFFTDYNLSLQTLRFRQSLYVFLAIKVVYWLWYYDLYFGSNAMALASPYSLGGLKNIPFLLYNNTSNSLGYWFIFGTLFFIALSYFIKQIPIIFEFFLWLLVLNIHNKIYPTLSGGDFLLNQFLFFNCFFSKTYAHNLSWQNALSKCVHNISVAGILIQIQLVYLISAAAKLNSSDWLNGIAISNLIQVNHFNLYTSPCFIPNSVNYLLNYAVLAYQLLFPILMWVNKLKKPFLVFGICMHMYIILVTGLVGFGLIMLIAYIYFWPFKKQAPVDE